MKNISTVFLRIVIAFGGLFVLAFIVFVIPELNEELIETTPQWFYLPVIIVFYAASLPFFFVLYQTLKLLSVIDAYKAFSALSVAALRRIKYAAIIMTILFSAILPLLYVMAETQDAPGLLAIGIVLAGASVTVATFASVLQMVLHSAIALKDENDLTV
jgi:hypothetical protein